MNESVRTGGSPRGAMARKYPEIRGERCERPLETGKRDERAGAASVDRAQTMRGSGCSSMPNFARTPA
jgi:hypothetical protein